MSNSDPKTLRRTQRLVARGITLPIKAVAWAAADPLVTGGLLIALTRAPSDVRARLLGWFSRAGLSTDQVGLLVTSLKVLCGVGLVRRLNDALNRLALNNWHWTKPGAPFVFGDAAKSELVVVTGGCSGFGYEMVKGFSKHARVVILDISPVPPELQALPGVHYYQVDLSDFAAIESTAADVRRDLGDPTVLINNAGIANGARIINASADLTERIFKVNLASHFILIKEFLPAMLAARKGHIVTVASIASFIAAPGMVDYCCTKTGLLYLHEGLRSELRAYYEHGECIQTTCVHPSWHATGITKPFEARLAKMGLQCEPASYVSDAIIEQVLAGRSGQIFVPKSAQRQAGFRNWPLWMRDVMWAAIRRKRGSIF